NDTYGSAAGDAVLQGVGRLLTSSFRRADLLARWAGDQFVVGFYDTLQATAIQQLVDVQMKIRTLTFAVAATGRFSITISAGVAEFPSDADDLLELYVAADTAR